MPPATTGAGAGAGRAWRAVRVQNVVIDLGAVAFVGIGVVVGYWWAVSWLANAHGLGSARAGVGLDLAGDRRARPRMGNGVRRSDRVLDRKVSATDLTALTKRHG